MASVSDDGHVRVWDTDTCESQPTLGHSGSVNAVAFSADGRRAATGDSEGNIILWKADTFTRLAILHGHKAGVTCLYFSPDGGRLISGGDDKIVILWNARNALAIHGNVILKYIYMFILLCSF